MAAVVLALLFAVSRIVITEVMANPKGKTGAHYPEDRNEFIELFNPDSFEAVDLNDCILSDGDATDWLTAWTDSAIVEFSPGVILRTTWLNPGCYAVVLDSEYTDRSWTGGNHMPYRFPAGTLILTTHNTTLGNGLANTDPVIVAPLNCDTSTFGTPFNSNDSFPRDAGDGLSWERVHIDSSDKMSNWLPCRVPDSGTPGAPNSVSSFFDLAVTGITLADSAAARPGEPMSVTISVANSGFRASDSWTLHVFLDRNGNALADGDEASAKVSDSRLPSGQSKALPVSLTCPYGKTDLWARVECPDDGDSTNNSMRLTIIPGWSDRMFDLALSSFSPDGDGFEESLSVMYRLPEAKGTLKITVFNLAGKPVATLFSGRPMDARGVVCWDGRNSTGALAPTGVYAVAVEYRNRGSTRTEKLPVVLLRK